MVPALIPSSFSPPAVPFAAATVAAAAVAAGAPWPLDLDGAFCREKIEDAMAPVAAEKPGGGSDSLKLWDARRSRPLMEDRWVGTLEFLREGGEVLDAGLPGCSSIAGKGSLPSRGVVMVTI